MFGEDLDDLAKLLPHLDKGTCWDQHKEECIGRLYDITDRCLEFHRKKRPELVEFIPELVEVRHRTESLQALETEWVMGPWVEVEADEKEMSTLLTDEDTVKIVLKFFEPVKTNDWVQLEMVSGIRTNSFALETMRQ